MEKTYAHFTWIDWCLSAAIAALSILLLAMLFEPAVQAWRHRPRPGMQVAQQYVAGQGAAEAGFDGIDW